MTFFYASNEPLTMTDMELEPALILPSDAPLKQAIALVASREKGISHSCILVQEKGAIVGILTERDLVRLSLSSKTIQDITVRDVMTQPIVTLEQENFTDIFSVYSLMRRHRIRHLPILDQQQRVLGIVTMSLLRQSLHLGYFLRFRDVQEIMTHQTIVATPDMSALDAAQLMVKNRISCVIIVKEIDNMIKPVGIITERDIVQLQGMDMNLQTLTTGEVMSHPLIYLHPEDSLAIAQKMMQEYRIRRVVVIDKKGELKGIITDTNLSQILDPMELFGVLEILQHHVHKLTKDRDRLLPQENLNLLNALENNEFRLYYQPQMNMKTRELVGAEILVRWNSPQRGLISPSEFIPIAEMTGFIVPLGEWILRQACEQALDWQRQGLAPLEISVNLSSHQLQDPQLVTNLKQLLLDLDFDPQWLKLELTESSLVNNIEHTLFQFQAIKQLGISIAIDDFGTGYASLGYLQHFPFDTLKIDRCFVENIHENPKNAAITTAIIRMAQQLNFSVVAEGVEQEAEMHFLCNHHCHIIQGYLISHPLPAADFLKFRQQVLRPLE